MTNTWKSVTPLGRNFPQAVAADPTRTLLAFDFDGTLAPIVQNPADVQMLEASADALAQLAARGVNIAIISGRPVDTIVELADVANRAAFKDALIYGQYGAETLDVRTGDRYVPGAPEGVGAARCALEALAGRYPGARVEDKRLAAAVHVREVADRDRVFSEIEGEARAIAATHGLTVEPGRYVWELRASAVTKGDALRDLVRRLRPKAVMFAGDDLGDIAAIAALQKMRASPNGPQGCVVISSSAEAPELEGEGDVLCDGPEGVANWLQHLADLLAVGDM